MLRGGVIAPSPRAFEVLAFRGAASVTETFCGTDRIVANWLLTMFAHQQTVWWTG